MLITASYQLVLCIVWNKVWLVDGRPPAPTQTCVGLGLSCHPFATGQRNSAALCLTFFRLRPPFQTRFCISFVNARADWEPCTWGARSKPSWCFWMPFAVRQEQNHWGSFSKERLRSMEVLSCHVKARTQSFPTELQRLRALMGV